MKPSLSGSSSLPLESCRAIVIAIAATCVCLLPCRSRSADPVCSPGWQGAVLIDGESLAGWSVETDSGSTGSLELASGLVSGRSVALEWDLGTGDWVQAKHVFQTPPDLSRADIFGVSLRGGGPSELPNTVGLMFADVEDVFYGWEVSGLERGLNQVDRPILNLPVPRRLFRYYFSFGATRTIDWSRIDRFFLVLKRPRPGSGGGHGSLSLDSLQEGTAAEWGRPDRVDIVSGGADAARRAIEYLVGQQQPTGLLVSWKEEPSPKAWLYDQALALIALTRAGTWEAGAPRDAPGRSAARLADFLVGSQKEDGHWNRGWDPRSGRTVAEDDWVGDQAWSALALALHAEKTGDARAEAAARGAAEWLAARLDPTGRLTASTEGNVDAWWAFVATRRFADAARVREHLLGPAWDPELGYWWRGHEDPVVALDCATWLSAFARHPLGGVPDRALAALGFVRRTLVTTSDDGSRCGFDGQGPVSIWNEGTAQYVAAGGPDSGQFLAGLAASQQEDGSLAGSPDEWATDGFGWLTRWSGVAPTAWFYFALTGTPHPMTLSVARGDLNGDGARDVSDAVAVLAFLFAGEEIRVPCPHTVADTNSDATVDLSDAIFLLSYLFLGGPPLDPFLRDCR